MFNGEETFELTANHLKLLQALEWMPGQCGTLETDQKRPFGNSGDYAIAADIAEILEWNLNEPYEERALLLFEELSTALKIILANCTVEPDCYHKVHREASWGRKQHGQKT